MQKCVDAGMSSDPLTVAYLYEVNAGLCARRKLKPRKRRSGERDGSDFAIKSEGSFAVSSETSRLSSQSETVHSTMDGECEPSTSRGDVSEAKRLTFSTMSSDAAFVRRKLAERTHLRLEQQALAQNTSQKVKLAEPCAKVERAAEISPFSDEDYMNSVATCRMFAEVMSMPFSAAEMGPVMENMLPDDPVALARFPEAALRKYVSALRNVPEFRDSLSQNERFLMLKVSLIRQQGIVVAYFGDPFERCFRGTIASGASFCHPISYSREQFDKSGVESGEALESMMTLYHRLRQFPYRSDQVWPVVAAYLCIIKFFSPLNFSASNGPLSFFSLSESDQAELPGLLAKTTAMNFKYKALFKRHVQTLIDTRVGVAPSSRIEQSTDASCEDLLCETKKTCDIVAAFFKNLLQSFLVCEQSDVLVPLLSELLGS